jgi:exodeoxyribonuclease VII large subunit
VNEPLRRVWSVTDLASAIKGELQTAFPDVQVRGEVSGLAAPASGHVYFTLKDDRAAIRCVLYKQIKRYLHTEVEAGKEVVVRGKVSSYGPRSEYQIVVDFLEPVGEGALHAAFVALQKKLAAEGYFDQVRKRPLPRLPERVGIVTSLAGAALHDMLRIIRARRPGQQVVVAGTLVQGETAAPKIAHAIELLANHGDPDVIIVGRGGGSLEDLWCWNEEVVVQAVVDCPVPVVSGVGHEVDVSLCDLAADLRAATPTHAAELVVPDVNELLHKVALLDRRAERTLTGQVGRLRDRLNHLQHRLRQEADPTALAGRELDELMARLVPATKRQLGELRHDIVLVRQRLAAASPERQLTRRRDRVGGLTQRLAAAWQTSLQAHRHTAARRRDKIAALEHRLQRAMAARLSDERQQIAQARARLTDINPLTVLERGYAIVTTADGTALKDAAQVAGGERIGVRVHRGALTAEVTARKLPPTTFSHNDRNLTLEPKKH